MASPSQIESGGAQAEFKFLVSAPDKIKGVMKPHFSLPFVGALLLFAGAGCGGGTSPQRPAPTPVPVALKSIVFVSTRDGAPELYRMNPDGSEQTRITTGIGSADNPSQARDGRIVFQSNRDGNSEIYRVNRDGSNLVRLTNDAPGAAVFDGQPVFSPDGQTIAWSSRRGGSGDTDVYLMNSSGENQRKFATGRDNSNTPAWTRDGRKLAYFYSSPNERSEVNSLDVRTVKGEQLTFTEFGLVSSVKHMRFNSDNTRIIFSSGAFGFMDISTYDFGVRPELGPFVPPRGVSVNLAPNFSPDGRFIIWDARTGADRNDIFQNRTPRQIYRANADGTGVTALTTQGSNFSPDF